MHSRKTGLRNNIAVETLFLLLSIIAVIFVEASPVQVSKIVYASPEDSWWQERAVYRILANGTVTPWTPNIFVSSDCSTYTFLSDLYVPTGVDKDVAILVERDNIVIDGNGYKLEGNESSGSIGIKMYFPEFFLPVDELPKGVG
ncbi:MAG: hypothetical protein QXX08_08065, partial [Candidatus Bathyarchaeia archaeon]